jgi:23S rRNA pseudouridine1911/1915/1917 synthase
MKREVLTPSVISKQSLRATESNDRLDLFLHQSFPDHSRSMFQRLIREGKVWVNGKSGISKASIAPGDEIEIEFPAPKPTQLEPESMSLSILYEDKHLVVLDKPAGLVVHPGAGHAEHTLVHALLHHCRGQLSGIGGVERPGIVHRLDKDTSGCLVIAKTDLVHRKLAEAFHSRSVEKIYLALVWGKPRMLSGRIAKPIGRHAVNRRKMAVNEAGKEALTEWKLHQALNHVSLLECRLHTGRTHQIRVHLASVQLPIVGDALYGRAQSNAGSKARRQMLHAWKLSFEHPVKGVKINCEAPLPEDMKSLIDEAAIPEEPVRSRLSLRRH